jgi:hypothetical protein
MTYIRALVIASVAALTAMAERLARVVCGVAGVENDIVVRG